LLPHQLDLPDRFLVDDRTCDQQAEPEQIVGANWYRRDHPDSQRRRHDVHGEDVGDDDSPLAPQPPPPRVQSRQAAPGFDAIKPVARTH
jgi:hypothetical protein